MWHGSRRSNPPRHRPVRHRTTERPTAHQLRVRDRPVPQATAGGLTRSTFNATAHATAGLTTIMAASGDNKTDAINNSLRAMATLLGLAHDDGALRVIAPHGTTHTVHLS